MDMYSPHFEICDNILRCIDLPEMPDVNIRDHLSEPDNQVRAALKELEDEGYIIRPKKQYLPFSCRITIRGSKFINSNGYKEKLESESTTNILTNEKLRIDVKNARRIYNTYWYTFGMSIAALIISLGLLILKLIE